MAENDRKTWKDWLKGSSLPGWLTAAVLVGGSMYGNFVADPQAVQDNTEAIVTLKKEKADRDRVWGKFSSIQKKMDDLAEARKDDSKAIQSIQRDISSIKATLEAMNERMNRGNVGIIAEPDADVNTES